MIYLDANFFIFANFDIGEKGQNARKLQESIIKGKAALTSSLTLDEVMWVILKNKRESQLRETIQEIYATPNLEICEVGKTTPLIALDFIESYKLKPRDAMHAAIMKSFGIDEIASDDTDFDRIKGMRRIKF